LSGINAGFQERGIRAVNTLLTLRNWFFGFYIVEFEQGGEDRAKYGKGLLINISKEMQKRGIPNTDARQLRRYRQFYLAYPAAASVLANNPEIRGLLSPELVQSGDLEKRESTTAKFEVVDNHIARLFDRLSYTHFIELVQIDDPLKRLFYELECIKGTWSVKELRRQIGSLLYERTGLSKNKDAILEMPQSKEPNQTILHYIRDPYVFEFVGLKQQEVLPERQLEQALLDNLLQFLLELGKGFCFEARQKRIVIDNEHYFVDLVFYHRLLHCNVLIEVKTERFHHSHAGQLNMYLEYYKKYEMAQGDNPPIGILLCTDKDQEHVEFATAGMDDKLFVSKYMVGLPDVKQLKEFVKKEWEGSLGKN
jgi:predicted nuclease of restriction endonuclease-like (RecB) superfamily